MERLLDKLLIAGRQCCRQRRPYGQTDRGMEDRLTMKETQKLTETDNRRADRAKHIDTVNKDNKQQGH